MIVDNQHNQGQDLAEGKSDEEDGEKYKDSHLAFNSVLKFLLVVFTLYM